MAATRPRRSNGKEDIQYRTDMPGPVREDPPRGGEVTHAELLKNLTELTTNRPGEFYRIAVYRSPKSARNCAYELRQGQRPRPAGRWQFKSGQMRDSSGWAVWAMYEGPDSEPAS